MAKKVIRETFLLQMIADNYGITFMILLPLVDKKLEIAYSQETGSHISHRVAHTPDY